MSPGPVGWALLLLWSGLCSADQRAAGARQIHQPIVAASIAGLLAGDPGRAFLVGLWLQLVWAAPMPVGGAMLPDSGAAAVAGAIAAVLLPGSGGLFIAILAALAWASLSIPWERRLRAGNESREETDLKRFGRVRGGSILLGIAGPFVRGISIAGATGAAASIGSDWIPARWLHWGGSRLEDGLLGGAAVVAVAVLLTRARAEAGRSFAVWGVLGVAGGLAGRFIWEWLR